MSDNKKNSLNFYKILKLINGKILFGAINGHKDV